MPKDAGDLAATAAAALNQRWTALLNKADAGALEDALADPDLRIAISRSVNSGIKTYRYVLPTQVVAKLADPEVDCRSVQASSALTGAFDARSICDKVVVPFDRANEGVLGGSPEPYVNNPLRVDAIIPERSDAQKNRSGWADLCFVLGQLEAQRDPAFTAQVLDQILIEIWRRLAQVKVTYPIPLRIQLDATLALIETFLAQGSGGDRAQAVIAALFRTLGEQFRLYSHVRRENINAADAASGQVADLECLNDDGDVVAAIEVKDRPLTILQVQDKLPRMREERISEIFFLALKPTRAEDLIGISGISAREFTAGHNIYVFDNLRSFMAPLLSLLGEEGRRRFLEAIGKELDAYRSDLVHRRAWAELLRHT